MSKLMPTVGDRIIYFPTVQEKENMANAPACNTAEALPGVVTAAWSAETINAKIQLDGAVPDLWLTSILKGKDEMNWCWPHEFNQ